MTRSTFRYPGVKPFETSEAHQYFGRQRDVQDLHDMMMLEKLVVLFGKSGYGKSSLLNAGIIPLLHKQSPSRQFVPLVIKFSTYTPEHPVSLLQVVKDRIRGAYPGFLQALQAAPLVGNEHSLWHLFKTWQGAEQKRRFMLLFDQFEEFFTYPLDQQVQFRAQLAELLYTEIPQAIRDGWDTRTDAEKELLSEELNVHAILAIREDRLSWLNTLKEELPAILHQRYELRGLTEEQAREAILRPAELPQEAGFVSHAFGYREEALRILLDELKKGGADTTYNFRQQGRIEAFLLQICCENIERKLVERAQQGDLDLVVDPEDLPRFDRIYDEYYNNKIAELPDEQRDIAKRLIENELVSLNEATGVVFRLSADGRKLITQPGVTEALLKKLTDSFLLRSEPNTTGGFNYEISHDTLVAPVLKAREVRLAAEKRRREDQQRLEREQELARERSRRQRATVIAALGFLLSAVAIGASLYAFRLRNKALEAQQAAETAQRAADAARSNAETRLKDLLREKAAACIQRGDSYVQNDEPRLALIEFEQALKWEPDNTDTQAKIRRIKQLLGIQ